MSAAGRIVPTRRDRYGDLVPLVPCPCDAPTGARCEDSNLAWCRYLVAITPSEAAVRCSAPSDSTEEPEAAA